MPMRTSSNPALYTFDAAKRAEHGNICGVDEAGRGPLCGPVCVAAVILNPDDPIEGVNDSKKLSEKKREELFPVICEKALAYGIGWADEREIDEINILNATKQAMQQAIMSLKVKPNVVLVDAVQLDIPYKTHAIIKGDTLSYSIGCASILAKVTRDAYMIKADEIYPDYGFRSNKGYGSAKHIAALKEKGATPIHRKSFIKNFVGDNK